MTERVSFIQRKRRRTLRKCFFLMGDQEEPFAKLLRWARASPKFLFIRPSAETARASPLRHDAQSVARAAAQTGAWNFTSTIFPRRAFRRLPTGHRVPLRTSSRH